MYPIPLESCEKYGLFADLRSPNHQNEFNVSRPSFNPPRLSTLNNLQIPTQNNSQNITSPSIQSGLLSPQALSNKISSLSSTLSPILNSTLPFSTLDDTLNVYKQTHEKFKNVKISEEPVIKIESHSPGQKPLKKRGRKLVPIFKMVLKIP